MSSNFEAVVDTVVLMYFLLTAQEELLFEVLGEPLAVPLTVYDPSEPKDGSGGIRSDLLSEMHQVIHHYEIAERTDESAHRGLERVKKIEELVNSGRIATVELTASELELTARLQDPDVVSEFGLKAPLGPGEAACVAISWERGCVIATDDADALRSLEHLHGRNDFPFERIRKLLIRAATSGLITRGDANHLHAEMRRAGFWDKGQPFP